MVRDSSAVSAVTPSSSWSAWKLVMGVLLGDLGLTGLDLGGPQRAVGDEPRLGGVGLETSPPP